MNHSTNPQPRPNPSVPQPQGYQSYNYPPPPLPAYVYGPGGVVQQQMMIPGFAFTYYITYIFICFPF